MGAAALLSGACVLDNHFGDVKVAFHTEDIHPAEVVGTAGWAGGLHQCITDFIDFGLGFLQWGLTLDQSRLAPHQRFEPIHLKVIKRLRHYRVGISRTF